MSDLNNYFSRLMLRELDNFRAGPANPAADTTNTAATEVADTTAASPPATGQDEPTTPAETANSPSPSPSPSPTPSSPTTITTAAEEDETKQPKPAAALPATGVQASTPLRLLTIPNTTDRQRRNNGARQQRVYRLAAKFGVSPGAARWIRGGRAYAQPAVPRAVVVDNNKTVEYNQFMYSDSGSDKVVLRMPGGWKRDLVRGRPQFRGVAVIDGFLWPRFSPNLPRRMTVDWGKSPCNAFLVARWKLTLGL